MTTKYETIHHTFCDGDIVPENATPTREDVDRYSAALATALADAFPGAEVSIDVQRRTSGGGSTTVFYPEADYPQAGLDEDRAREIAGRVWMAWSETLAPVEQ